MPLGSLVADLPDMPDEFVKGDMIVYARGGTQNLYRETRKTMEELSADVANVQRFHRSGTRLDKLNDAWTKVFSDVTQVR